MQFWKDDKDYRDSLMRAILIGFFVGVLWALLTAGIAHGQSTPRSTTSRNFDVMEYGASGSITQVNATCTFGSGAVTLSAAGDFKTGQYIMIDQGGTQAGGLGLPLFAQITAGGGTTSITVSPVCGNGVTGVMTHDDSVGINAAIDACTTAFNAGGASFGGGGKIYFPGGTYQVMSAPIHHHSPYCVFDGAGMTASNIAPYFTRSYAGPALVSTGGTSIASYMSVVSFPAALLTGSGTAFSPTNNGWFDLRDARFVGDLNGLVQFTGEATIKLTNLTNSGFVLASGAARDNFDGLRDAFYLEVLSNGTLEGRLVTGGTPHVLDSSAGAIVSGTAYHTALSYDGTTIRLFLAGTSVATAAASGTVTQNPLESMSIGPMVTAFPENVTTLPIAGSIDGVRLSNTARYTSNFTPPAAKWTLAQLDGNTMAQCDFDSQPDVFTVCYSDFGGSPGYNAPVPVYLPLHRGGICGSNGDEGIHIEHLSFGDSSGRTSGQSGGIYYNGGPHLAARDFELISDYNGFLLGPCSYSYGIYNALLGGFGATRYGIATNTGIGTISQVHIATAYIGMDVPGNGNYDHIYVTPSNVQTAIPILITNQQGAITIANARPSFRLESVSCDVESANAALIACLMIDGGANGISGRVGNADLEVPSANATAYDAIVQSSGTGSAQTMVVFDSDAFGGNLGGSVSNAVNISGTGTASIIFLNPQNQSGLALFNNSATAKVIVCGGNGTSSSIGCTMPQIIAVGAACTNGELALSAGWGTTAAATAVHGTGQVCSWTITASGTGQAANPTITDTLTNPLPSSSTDCWMIMQGGTQALTSIQQTTFSATAPVFTFNGTPGAGNTVLVKRGCGP